MLFKVYGHMISHFTFLFLFFGKGTNEWNLIIKMVTKRNKQRKKNEHKTSFPVDLIGKILWLQNIISFEFILYGQKDALGFNKKYEFQKCYLF